RSEVFLIGILWGINAGVGISQQTPFMTIFLFMPILTVVSAVNGRRNDLQLAFMLPFKRSEIIARLGGALFLSMLRTWFGYAVATYFVTWMPLPGVIREIPSPVPLLVSLAAQFPLFGIAMIALMLRQVKLIYLAAAPVLAAATLTTGFASNIQTGLIM